LSDFDKAIGLRADNPDAFNNRVPRSTSSSGRRGAGGPSTGDRRSSPTMPKPITIAAPRFSNSGDFDSAQAEFARRLR